MFRVTTIRCWNSRLRALAVWAMMPLMAMDARTVCGSVCADVPCNSVAASSSCCADRSVHLLPAPAGDAVISRTHCETFSGLQVNPMVGVESDTDGWRSLHFSVIDYVAPPASLLPVIAQCDSDTRGLHGHFPDLTIELCKLVI